MHSPSVALHFDPLLVRRGDGVLPTAAMTATVAALVAQDAGADAQRLGRRRRVGEGDEGVEGTAVLGRQVAAVQAAFAYFFSWPRTSPAGHRGVWTLT